METNRLEWMAKKGMVPFDLDFLRALGFSFGADWDGEVLITQPSSIDVDTITELIYRFTKGIKRRLYFEGRKGMAVCVGGPKNGVNISIAPRDPILFHLHRGEWAVYSRKENGLNDPRAWFIGKATSRKKARELWMTV